MNPSSANIEIGIVSDEIALAFSDAVKTGLSWGVSRYEIRSVASGRIPYTDGNDLRLIRSFVRDGTITVTALSPGFFKLPVSDRKEIDRQIQDGLPRTIEIARELGAPMIIVFGFQREGNQQSGERQVVVERMRQVAEAAVRAGITIAVENEPGFWCDSGSHTAQLLADVDSPGLRANWDPANAVGTGEEPYPDGYRALRKYIVNVHVKDTVRGALVECVPVGEGRIDWRSQLASLINDGVVRHVTVETHCPPLVEKSRRNIETLRRMLDDILRGQERQTSLDDKEETRS